MDTARSIPGQATSSRLHARLDRRGLVSISPAFYDRLGVASPFAARGELGSREGGFSFLSAIPYYERMSAFTERRARLFRRLGPVETDGAPRRAGATSSWARQGVAMADAVWLEAPPSTDGAEVAAAPRQRRSAWAREARPRTLERAVARPGPRAEPAQARALRSAADHAVAPARRQALRRAADAVAIAAPRARDGAARRARRAVDPGPRAGADQDLGVRRQRSDVRPLAVARGRMEMGSSRRGLRPVLANSPVALALEPAPARAPASQDAAAPPRRAAASDIAPAGIRRASSRREPPVAAVRSAARTQQVSGRAGPVAQLLGATAPERESSRPTSWLVQRAPRPGVPQHAKSSAPPTAAVDSREWTERVASRGDRPAVAEGGDRLAPRRVRRAVQPHRAADLDVGAVWPPAELTGSTERAVWPPTELTGSTERAVAAPPGVAPAEFASSERIAARALGVAGLTPTSLAPIGYASVAAGARVELSSSPMTAPVERASARMDPPASRGGRAARYVMAPPMAHVEPAAPESSDERAPDARSWANATSRVRSGWAPRSAAPPAVQQTAAEGASLRAAPRLRSAAALPATVDRASLRAAAQRGATGAGSSAVRSARAARPLPLPAVLAEARLPAGGQPESAGSAQRPTSPTWNAAARASLGAPSARTAAPSPVAHVTADPRVARRIAAVPSPAVAATRRAWPSLRAAVRDRVVARSDSRERALSMTAPAGHVGVANAVASVRPPGIAERRGPSHRRRGLLGWKRR